MTAPASPTRAVVAPVARAWAVRLGAIAIAQLLFWFGLRPVLLAPATPPALATVIAVRVARLPADVPASRVPTPATLADAMSSLVFDSVSVPWTGCCEPAQHVVRFTVRLDSVPAEGLGVLARLDVDNAWLFVNSTFAAGVGRLNLEHPTRLRLRSAWFTPAALWTVGANTVDVVTVNRTSPYTDVLAPWIAPWHALNSAIAWREFVFREYAWVSLAVTSVLALLGFTLWARGGRTPALWWPSLLLLAWTGRTLLGQDVAAVLPPDWRIPSVFAAEMTLALAWFGIADTWLGAGWQRARRALSILTGVAWLLALILLQRDVPAPLGFDQAAMLHHWTGLGLVALALTRAARPLLRAPAVGAEGRDAEAAVLSVLITLLGLDFWSELTSQQVGGYLASSLPLLFVAFAVAFAARNIRLFRSTSEINQLLGARLAERERELAQSFEARAEVTRQQALYEERTRIMRDMHDGIGGRLLSLVAQLRDGAPPLAPPRVADELLAALEEVRLIVDSLDTAGDDLGLALGAFRTRMAPRLRAAGITLAWHIDEAAVSPALSASAILDVYRIMQEACANMLRHAGADRFSVALRSTPSGGRVLELADNGCGLVDADRTVGRGLSNMRTRAARLGGRLSLGDAGPGVCLRLELPPLPAE